MEKYFLVLVVLMVCRLSAGFSCTKNVKFDDTCTKDCSQKPPRIPGDNVVFNCSIGNQKEVDRYRKTHTKEFRSQSVIFDAPKIHGVEIYIKHYKDNKVAYAMKFNFHLPKGITRYEKSDVWRLPKAILLKFESIPGPYEDTYYVNCHREKIYEFQFLPIHAYDIINPRQLTEDCIVGLDNLKPTLVYNITLQTAEGKNASYITTVKVRTSPPVFWHPTIMSYLNDTDATLYTVIEKPPSDYEVQSYNVSLVNRKNIISRSTKIKVKDTNATSFSQLTRGQYKIRVRPVCNGICNKTINVDTESYRVDVSMPFINPIEKEYPHYLEETLEPMKVVAMVMGCILGVILLLTIIYFIRRRQKFSEEKSGLRPSGILLHPFEKEGDAMFILKRFISQACDCTVTNCMEFYPASEHQAEKVTTDRVDKCLKDSAFVLVLYYSGCYDSNTTSFNTDFYSCFLQRTFNRREMHNDIRIVPLQLPLNTSSDLPSVIRNSVQPIEVVDGPDNVFCRIHSLEKFPPNRQCISSTHLSKWREIWSELNQTIIHAEKNVSTAHGEAEPLLQGTNIVEDNIDLGKQDQEIVKPNGKNLFREIALINTETDSVIGSLDRVRIKPRVSLSKENTQNLINQQTYDNGKNQIVENAGESRHEFLPKSNNEIIEQSNDDSTCNQSRIQMFEAEVHYSADNPLGNGRPHDHPKDQPLSWPENASYHHHHDISRIQRIPRKKFESENHHHHHNHHLRQGSTTTNNNFNEKGNRSDGRSEFTSVMEFNTEDFDMDDGFIDDTNTNHISDTEIKQEVYSTDEYYRHPLLHGNLHHRPFLTPNGEFSHRHPVHQENSNHLGNGFPEFHPDHLYDQPNMHCIGNTDSSRQYGVNANNYRPCISHRMTHQQILNNNNYDQTTNDLISSIHDHEEALSINSMHPSDFDEDDYLGHHHQRLLNHQDDVQHLVKHLNETDRSLMSPAHEQNINNLKKDYKPPPARISFEALDPPKKEELKDNAPVLDVNKKYELATRNTNELLKVSSIQSLPSDLSGVLLYDEGITERFSPPEDLHNDSTEPPHDIDEGWESQIMDEFIQINESNTLYIL